MSIRLCQECSQWVWTRAGRCPDCQDALPETNNPDESTSRFQTLIGTVHGRIGYVRIPRRKLPAEGVLYETERGLFFLPHQTVTRTRLVESHSSSPMWTVAAALWTPLVILLPFLKGQQLKEQPVQETEPVRLTRDNLHLLPELLSRHPGSFFVPLSAVRSIRAKPNQWKIERIRGAPITIQPAEAIAFTQRMNELLAADAWKFLTDYS